MKKTIIYFLVACVFIMGISACYLYGFQLLAIGCAIVTGWVLRAIQDSIAAKTKEEIDGFNTHKAKHYFDLFMDSNVRQPQ